MSDFAHTSNPLSLSRWPPTLHFQTFPWEKRLLTIGKSIALISPRSIGDSCLFEFRSGDSEHV
jgi:hypothetical protein